MEFPQYRKLEGFQRFYRISGERTFTEVSVVNGKAASSVIEARQYPEMLRIKDMLDCQWNYREMDAEEIALYFPDEKDPQ